MGNAVQLGVDCATSTPAQKSASGFTSSRYVHMNGWNLILGDGGRVGIGMPVAPVGQACAVGNKLEIDNGPTNANTSGLRFTRLTSSSPTQLNPGVGVLALNQFGDVIYVPGVGDGDNGLSTSGPTPGKLHLGQNLGAAGNPGRLLNDREIPMNNFNLLFSDPVTQTAFQNRIQIGSNPTTFQFNTLSKISAFNNSTQLQQSGITGCSDGNIPVMPLVMHPYYFTNIGNIVKLGVLGIGNNQANSAVNAQHVVGVEGVAYNNATGPAKTAYGCVGRAWTPLTTASAIGMYGTASGLQFAAGVIGRVNSGATCIGLQGIATNATINNIGVYGFGNAQNLTPTYPNINIGVYGVADPPVLQPAGGSARYAGYFDGDVFINGLQGVPGFAVTSDSQFKTNVDTISNPLFILAQLKPRTYRLDTMNNYGMRFSSKQQYGFIAQDVESVLPELVSVSMKPEMLDSLGAVVTPSVAYKNLNYNALFALLTAAFQKQQTVIDSLVSLTKKQDAINTSFQSQIDNIVTTFSACCSNSAVRTTGVHDKNLTTLDIELSDKDVIVLNQNVPNPFAEQTTITYNVPEQYGFAQIIFKTLDGKIIKAVDINKKGKGQLNVFANDLSNGLYMYSLIVDGKVIDTKKMVKQ